MLEGDAGIQVEETKGVVIGGGVTLLALRMPSAVKYHSSTYSMILILSRVNCAGKKGSLFRMKASSSKSRKVVFFLIGKISSRSSWTWGWGGGGGGGGAGGGGEGMWGTGTLVLFHMAWRQTMASSSEQEKWVMMVCLIGWNSGLFH